MKTESYKQAVDKMHKLVGEAVMGKIPTLDHMMGVKNMSDEDKIWYEAYKKYGNRNHTWQDFRDMFYGNVDIMQKTVAHWKTWNEINTTMYVNQPKMYELIKEIRQLLKKYDLKSFNPDKKEEYERYKREYPDLVDVYERCMEIDKISQPNYTTFNPQVAKLETEFEKKSKAIEKEDKKAKIDLVVDYLQKMDEYVDLKNGEFVVGERIETYRKIILNNSEILKQIGNFDNLSVDEKINLARVILNESSKNMGTPRGRIIQDDAPDGPHALKENQDGGYNRGTQEFLFKSDAFMFTSLFAFLKTLAHEDAHRVDLYNAEYGMVGSQLMYFVDNNYLNNKDIDVALYKKWATEQSSYYLDNTTGAALKYMIEHQNS